MHLPAIWPAFAGSILAFVIVADQAAAAEPNSPPAPAKDLHGDPLPAGAVVRLGTVRFRHPGYRPNVLFAPDGKTVLSTGDGTSLRVWDAATGKQLRRIDIAGDLSTVALSPDGKVLAAPDRPQPGRPGGVIKLWDLAAWKELRALPYPEGTPTALRFFPDGKTLVGVGGAAGKVRLWDVAWGRGLGAFKVKASGWDILAVAPDGTLLVTSDLGSPGGVQSLLAGGTGRRNILVAGGSGGTLLGGDGEDLLIAGTTAYDTEADLATWRQLAAYWAGGDDFLSRVANLTNGAGVPQLNAATVAGNGGGNTLIGNGGLAWLFSDGLDFITGFDPASQQAAINP